MANVSDSETSCLLNYDAYPFTDIAPTLAQCYFLIIIGYLVAKFQVLSAADIRGVNAFVSYVGMPGILCMTMADADVADTRWELVLALFLVKLIVFVLVAGVSYATNHNAGIAGMLAVFCVHANDLPVGNPLMSSLYKRYRPQMMKYLFLMPPMTVVFFVPLGNFLLEIHRARRMRENSTIAHTEGPIKWKDVITKREISSIPKSVLKAGPAVVATTLGIILNFAFKGKMPAFIHQPFQLISATVPGCVVSILGFNLVRKERYLLTSAVVTAIILLAVKMFLTPLLTHLVTRLLTKESDSSKLLTDFALLYGIISPAIAVFLSGQEFRKPLAAMSAALIMSSFLCFPAFYFVARFAPDVCDLDHYIPRLKEVLFWMACLTISCDIFVGIKIFLKRKWTTVPYCYILCLILTQLLTASGIIFWILGETQQWTVYCQMALYYGGEISGYFWMGAGAGMLILSNCSTVIRQRIPTITFVIFIICGVVISAVSLVVFCCDIKKTYILGRTNSYFEYMLLMICTMIQALTICVVFVCLMLHSKKKHLESFGNEKKQGFCNPVFCMEPEDVTIIFYKKRSLSILSALSEKEESDLYYKEIFHSSGKSEHISRTNQAWTFCFISLLVLLLITISLKFVSNLYKLFHSNALEIMIPLEFLQSSLFVGQGIFVLLTFGIDLRTVSIEIIKWWRYIRYGKEEFVATPSKLDEKSDEALFCNQFKSFYLKSCYQNIVKNRKWKDNVYKDCFWGHQLIDWLIQEGVAKDDIEAEELGQKLMVGGVISHVAGAHHFHNAPYLYFFNEEAKQKLTFNSLP